MRVIALGLAAVALSVHVALGGEATRSVRLVDCAQRASPVEIPFAWLRRGVVFGRGRSLIELSLGNPRGRVLPLPWGEPVWSPSEFVVALSRSAAGRFVVEVIAAGRERFTVRRARRPAWSADGAWLGYQNGAAHVHGVRASGSGDRDLGQFTDFDWSPVGHRLAYADGRGIWVLDLDGSMRRLVVEPTRPVNGLVLRVPRWSPTGGEIAYIAERNGVTELLAVHPDGSGGRRITAAGVGGDYAWSPDGEQLAVRVGTRLGLVPAQSGRLRLLAADGLAKAHPLWSPDGRRFVYDARTHGRSEVWIADARTLRERRLTYHCQRPDPKSDRIQGTHLADRILARDGRRERISCGAGRDSVSADRRDVVARDCEVVRRR